MVVSKKTEPAPETTNEVAELRSQVAESRPQIAELKALIEKQANTPTNIIARERKVVVEHISKDRARVRTRYT